MPAFCARLALVLGLCAALGAGAAAGGEVKLVKGKSWKLTLRRAPRGWTRNHELGRQIICQMRRLHPEARAEFFALARDIGLERRGNARLQFWVVREALAAKPPKRDVAYLKFALATLHGSFVDPGVALKIAAEVDTSQLDKRTLGYFKNRVAFWNDWKCDILPIGRSFEAEQLLREASEFAGRREHRDAAVRLIKVMLRRPNGYYPLKSGVVLGTGVRARRLLSAMVLKHAREVAEAAEEVSPGLAARAATGDRGALKLLARVYPYTEKGWRALLRLGEEDLDAGRAELAALRFSRCLELAAGPRSRAEALWRLGLAHSAAGRPALAGAALRGLAAVRNGKVRIGGKDVAADRAAELARRELPARAAAIWKPPEVRAGAELAPRMTYTYQPSYWDLRVRCTYWPRFWRRPESEPVLDGDRVFLHDSRNAWALDWRRGKLLWHYRSPERIRQQNFRGRGYSNQINEARPTSRGYRVGVARGRVCGRFRTLHANLWYELRCLSAEDGRLLWSTEGRPELRGLSYASDPVGAYDRFYVLAFTPIHTSGAYLVCLRPEDGKVLWRTKVGSGVDSWGSDIGNIFSAHGGITVAGGSVYLSSDRGCFASLDALNGGLRWVSGIDRIYEKGSWVGTRGHTTRADRGAMVERSHSAPVVGEKLVYCLAKDAPGTFALDRVDGRRRFAQLPRTTVEVLGEHAGVAVAAGRGGLFGMRADGGEVIWERALKAGSVWRSGFLRGGKIYWPSGDQLLVLSAADGRELRRTKLACPHPPATLRPLPDGSIAALSSSGPVDQFMVLAPGVQKPSVLAEELPGAVVDPRCLSESHPRAKQVGGAALKPPPLAPITPVELLWRSDFSPEQIFTCRYPVRVLGDPPRLLVAGGNELRCYRLDADGALLWRTPVGPAPKRISLWGGGRVCLLWANGFDLVDLAGGRRVWGWSAWPIWGAAEAGEKVVVVWTRSSFAGVSVPDGKIIWTRRIVNNAWGINATRTPWGVLTQVRQDRDYGGRSYLDLLDPASGKVKWNYKFPKDTYCRLEGRLIWGWSRAGDRVSLVKAAEKSAREVWSRNIPGGGRVLFDADRILVARDHSGVTVLNRMTGKDALPRIEEKVAGFLPGPRVYTYRAKGTKYGQMVVRGLDRSTGKRLWEWKTGGGAAPESTASQVLVQGGSPVWSFWWRYYRHPSPARVTSLTSMDVRTGRLLGRFEVPGRDLDTSSSRRYQRNVIERDNLLVLRTEGGVAVLGSAGLRPPARVRSEIAALESRPPGMVRDRRMAVLRESLVRYTPPTIGAERCDAAPFLDGEFDDWEGATWTRLGRASDWSIDQGGALPAAAKSWRGAGDCSARFALRHDGQSLYLAVEVVDDDFSPPVGGSALTPGDCVEVGVALSTTRTDCLGADHDRRRPDLKVRLALIGGKPVARRVWYGSGSRAAISVRSGKVRYEAEIPFTGGRLRMARPDALGFSLRIVDADRGQQRGSLRWAGGLRGMGSSARFGSAVLASLSNAEIADSLRLAHLLPDSSLAYDLLYKVARARLAHGDARDARKHFAEFLTKNPSSHHASRCLAWCAHLDWLLRPSGKAADPGALFGRVKVAESERAQARMRLFARVRLPAGRRPTNLGLSLEVRTHARGRSLRRGVYWGRRRELLAGNMLWAGPLPDGEEMELSVPAEALGLANHAIASVSFAQYEGTAWWGDFGVTDTAGKRHVLVPAGAECKARGCNWAGGTAPDGKRGHWAGYLGMGWSLHRFTPPAKRRETVLLGAEPLASAELKLEQAGGRLPKKKCLEAAEVIPDNRLVVDLLAAVNDGPATAAFVRKHPDSPQLLSILEMLARSRDGAVRAVPGELLRAGAVRREVARSYYLRRAPGIGGWQVVGPFSNEADVALRRTYEPEERPTLRASYRRGPDTLKWKRVGTERDGYVNLSRELEAEDFQCGYAMCWVRAEKRRRAWMFMSTGNVVSVWVGDDRAAENVDGGGGRRRRGRHRRALSPVPVTLRKGWNRILVKCAGRWGYLGFKLHLGEADGAPLTGLKYGTAEPEAAREPK
jgi:outer membrane protein assembly factor BamB